MAYLVNLSLRAQRDLARIYRQTIFMQIRANDSGAALKWYRGFKRAILSLEGQPNRCPATPENEKLKQLLYGNKPPIYRAIYRVVEKQKRVEVLHIRHGAQHGYTEADVD
jgi:toxin ParE1/3/4